MVRYLWGTASMTLALGTSIIVIQWWILPCVLFTETCKAILVLSWHLIMVQTMNLLQDKKQYQEFNRGRGLWASMTTWDKFCALTVSRSAGYKVEQDILFQDNISAVEKNGKGSWFKLFYQPLLSGPDEIVLCQGKLASETTGYHYHLPNLKRQTCHNWTSIPYCDFCKRYMLKSHHQSSNSEQLHHVIDINSREAYLLF